MSFLFHVDKHNLRDFNFDYLCHPLRRPPPPLQIDLHPLRRLLPPPLFLSADYQLFVAVTTNKQLLCS